jgi:hypothetical protein
MDKTALNFIIGLNCTYNECIQIFKKFIILYIQIKNIYQVYNYYFVVTIHFADLNNY